jgi:hypothetical protein
MKENKLAGQWNATHVNTRGKHGISGGQNTDHDGRTSGNVHSVGEEARRIGSGGVPLRDLF